MTVLIVGSILNASTGTYNKSFDGEDILIHPTEFNSGVEIVDIEVIFNKLL